MSEIKPAHSIGYYWIALTSKLEEKFIAMYYPIEGHCGDCNQAHGLDYVWDLGGEQFEDHEVVVLSERIVFQKDLQERVNELEKAIRLHRTKVGLVQTEDMELWSHLNDGEQ